MRLGRIMRPMPDRVTYDPKQELDLHTRPQKDSLDSPAVSTVALLGTASVPDTRYDDALRSLRLSERIAPRSTCILRATNPGPRVRMLVKGWAYQCRMFSDGRRQITSILLPGDMFGLETLFDAQLGHAVWTATPATYAVLDAEATLNLFDTAPWFRRRLVRTLMQDKAASDHWMAQLGQYSAEERMASLMLQLYDRLGSLKMTVGRSFTLGLIQQELADLLGLHLIHVNRTLSRLRARGLIMIQGREVTLLDLDGLAELVPVLNHAPPAQEPE